MKKFKKILKITIISLVSLIAVAAAAPFIFKSKIIAYVKETINKKLTAKVDFKDVDISFFRHFPKVAIGVDQVQVVGTGIFESDTLLAAKRLDATVNIMSLIRGKDMTIYGVDVESPRIHAIVDKNGAANWDIVKPDTTSSATTEKSKPFTLQLQRYALTNAYISYKDEQGNMSSEIINLNHSGSGDFTADLFTLKTATKADAVTFTYGGIPYLASAKTSVDADIQVDNKQNSYSYNTDKIAVNDLLINSKGIIKMLNDGYNMDISFNAPSTDFKNILSLIPAVYQKDFDKVKATGNALFSGFVKGTYNEKQIPAYHVDMQVKNGFFQYADLPKAVHNINMNAQVDNKDGQTDNTVVNITNGHIELDKDPFDFRLLVEHPVTNMFIDAAAKGKLDLSNLTQYVKLEKDTRIAGLLDADVSVKGNVSAIAKQLYDQFNAAGTVGLNQFQYVSKDYPTGVKINTLQTVFNPKQVNIAALNGQYLNTNFDGTGQINNLLSYMLQNKPLNASLNVHADKINLNDWMGTSTDTTTIGTSASAPFAVPANLDVTLQTKADQVHYDKTDIQNLTGTLLVNNETVYLKDVKGNALDGTLAVNGTYSTLQSKKQPDIALDYNVAGVDVQKTFYAFNTIQKLMPIGKFMAGKLSSQLSLKGKLGENMMPDLSTLTGNGNLLLIQGFLSKFAPLDKIASTLNVKELEQISVKDVKNYFEFTNGKVLVKPFNVKVADIDMQIGGLQGIDQTLDYVINMKLPRSLMGTQGNQLVNNLVTQVNSKGVPVNVGSTVNLALKLGGTFTAPTIKTDLKQSAGNLADEMKQQVTDFAKAKIDSTKTAVTTAVKDTVKSLKNQALNAAKDELTKRLGGNGDANAADSAKGKMNPKESLKGLMNSLLKKKPKDTAAQH